MGAVQLKEIYFNALPQVELGQHLHDICVAIRRHVLGGSFYHIVLYDTRPSLKGDMVEASKSLFIRNANGSGTIAVA
jgi:hypothetical protein